ncbi:MAG: metal ABC transporter ATP-binding protein [Candidatus Eremiobacterota bacterium]
MNAPRSEPALEVHDLTVTYERRPVLWNVDVTIQDAQLVGIVGPNGAGKSTLIKAIMGLLPASSGWVKVYGQPFERMRSRVGYVPQRDTVDWDFPVTVRDVVTMGRYGRLGLFRRPGRQDRQMVDECLEKVGMAAFADRQIGNLSGGQQQRVFLARALAQDSQIYLMDEPFVGVDAATESAIVTLLEELRSKGRLALVVHHDLDSARQYFDSILLLNMRVVAYGPTEQVFTPELLRKTYGGRLTILSAVTEAVARSRQ